MAGKGVATGWVHHNYKAHLTPKDLGPGTCYSIESFFVHKCARQPRISFFFFDHCTVKSIPYYTIPYHADRVVAVPPSVAQLRL